MIYNMTLLSYWISVNTDTLKRQKKQLQKAKDWQRNGAGKMNIGDPEDSEAAVYVQQSLIKDCQRLAGCSSKEGIADKFLCFFVLQ
ncbi:hypothetical protein FOCC_FOCC015649 [Frankliniella occidentalis]|nr:hypothetical protein FOCC_FOCC015649 [Frankliniella occidentalis]